MYLTDSLVKKVDRMISDKKITKDLKILLEKQKNALTLLSSKENESDIESESENESDDE